jgi:phosphatidylserine/phosphatidylglycerophosphate/cardiolipin synthase-like enzyme
LSEPCANGYPTGFWFDIDAIYTARLKAIKSAQRTIHFETFYMTPGRRANEFAAALTERSQARVEVLLLVDSFGVLSMPKGVDVRILTAGPHNDKKLVYYAVRERYPDLLNAGIEIDEYQPSMMHAKVLLIDNTFVSTGSTNVDPRSFFHNDELHVSLAEAKLAQFVEHFFLSAFAKSRRIDRVKWQARPLLQRVLGRLALVVRWQL